jgi:hypothetical protein
MGNKIEKFIKFRALVFKYLLVFLIFGGGLLVLTALTQLLTTKAPPEFLQLFSIAIGIVSLFFIALFFICLFPLLIYWLVIRKDLPKLAVEEKKKVKEKFLLALGVAAGSIIFFFIITTFHLGAKQCDNSACFLESANNCWAVEWRMTDEAGMEWAFYASSYCRLEKKLLTITGQESQGLKNILEGQKLTCEYEQNKFDQLWIDSLVFDLEPCQGKLKESIAKLLLLL